VLTAVASLASLFGGGQTIPSISGLSPPSKSSRPVNPASALGSVGTAALPAISQVGQLLSGLQRLQQQDPAKFQRVLNSVADQLQAAAKQQSKDSQAQFFNQLAQEFRQAAQTGNLSGLITSQSASSARHRVHFAYAQNLHGAHQSALASLFVAGPGTPANAAVQQVLSSITSQVENALNRS
jgi:hypothetical protein